MILVDERFSRSERLFGKENIKKLFNSKVIVFGVGGVGGAVVEALARGGIGEIGIVDKDTVDITNINRQIIATDNTVGRFKTDAAEERILSINPFAKVNKYQMFYLPETADKIDLGCYDYAVDAIDNVSAKIELCVRAKQYGVPIISSMGTGNKVHPEMLEISDISKTSVCPLARVMRRELRNRGINHLDVVYSKEEPFTADFGRTPASCSFTPPVAGYLIASKVIKDLINKK